MNNGPAGQCVERTWLVFHKVDRSPLKCVLRRTIPELEKELEHVVNVFDRGLEIVETITVCNGNLKNTAESDEAFRKAVLE